MDPDLITFHRQYLQQIQNPIYPPPQLLAHTDIQDQLWRYFFDAERESFLPGVEYQRRVLKRVIGEIERGLDRERERRKVMGGGGHGGDDEDDDLAVSDDLMTHMGMLSSLPQRSDSESAQSPRVLTYSLPTFDHDGDDDNENHDRNHSNSNNGNNNDHDNREQTESTTNTPTPAPVQRILIEEMPRLLAASSNVGLRTWEASLHLSYYLCAMNVRSTSASEFASSTRCSPSSQRQSHRDRDTNTIKGANIIELGAGTGLLSLICSLGLGARRVVVTDGLEHVVSGIERNIEINRQYLLERSWHGSGHGEGVPSASLAKTMSAVQASSAEAAKSVATATNAPDLPIPKLLDWTNITDDILTNILREDNDDNKIPEYNYILGADITYSPTLFDPLVTLVHKLILWFPNIKVLISATERNEATMKLFRDVCEAKGLQVREVGWTGPEYKVQTGLFFEKQEGLRVLIMDITLKQA